MKYYLAGKIWKHDWRSHPGILGYRGGSIDDCGCPDASPAANETPIDNLCKVPGALYVGPFFVACDHGCYHGDRKHGQLYTFDEPDYKPTTRQGAQVVQKCLQWIKDADVVFARLSEDNPSGTLIELGYASSLGKEIWLWFSPENALTHWFSLHLPGVTHIWSGADNDISGKLTEWIVAYEEDNSLAGLDYKELLKRPEWQKKRLEVFDHYGWQCGNQLCLAKTKQLHVHHRSYAKNTLPWDYPLSNFEVLCEDCHASRHGRRAA